jgi:hypothetical protein
MIEVCIEKQQSLINDFDTRIKTLVETPGLGNEEEYNNDVLSHQSQDVSEINTPKSLEACKERNGHARLP